LKYPDKIKKAVTLPFLMTVIFFSACNKRENNLLLFDVDGNEVITAESKITVLFFLSTECPLSESYLTEIHEFKNTYSSMQFFFCQVYPGKFLNNNDLKSFLSKYKIDMPVAYDCENTLCTKLNAKTTPQVIVLNEDTILYSGQIDNRASDLQFKKLSATVFYLRDVLDAISKGQQPSVKFTEPIGCDIER
jgi:hypothetical protein